MNVAVLGLRIIRCAWAKQLIANAHTVGPHPKLQFQ